jgi:hypothetical protein
MSEERNDSNEALLAHFSKILSVCHDDDKEATRVIGEEIGHLLATSASFLDCHIEWEILFDSMKNGWLKAKIR